MATLNVKNFPDALYRRIKKRARDQQRSVAQEVTRILDEATGGSAPLSILSLRGLGQKQWKDVDASAHVDSERGAWD